MSARQRIPKPGKLETVTLLDYTKILLQQREGEFNPVFNAGKLGQISSKIHLTA
jgi:hypothetical protein